MQSSAVPLENLPANFSLKKYHTLIGITEAARFSRLDGGAAPEEIVKNRASELAKRLESLVNRLNNAVCVVDGAEAGGSQAMKVLAPAAAKVEEDETNVRLAVETFKSLFLTYFFKIAMIFA